MFGFGGSSSPKPASSSSNSSTPLPAEAPNREQRAACWAARDAYFACLDKNGMVAAGDEGEGGDVCAEERRRYEGGCGKSWIDYFNKRRMLELRQKATMEAAAKAREATPASAGR